MAVPLIGALFFRREEIVHATLLYRTPSSPNFRIYVGPVREVQYLTYVSKVHPHRRALKKYLQYCTCTVQYLTLDENPGGRVVQGGEYPELCTPGGAYLAWGGTNLPL